MTKEQTLESIQNAKKYHEIQMEKISGLIYGKVITDPTAVSKRECNFGHWLYSEEAHLRDILGAQFFESIEKTHGKWHEQYYKIYEIFYQKPKKGLISKMLKRDKVKQLEIDKAKLYYVELKQCTNELLNYMAISERRVLALSESKFQ